MNSLYVVVIIHVFIGVQANATSITEETCIVEMRIWCRKIGNETTEVYGDCKQFSGMEGLFSCLYNKYQAQTGCIEIIKKVIQSALCLRNIEHGNAMHYEVNKSLVELTEFPCTKGYENNRCTKEECRNILYFSIEIIQKQYGRYQGSNHTDLETSDNSTDVSTNDESKLFNGNKNVKQNKRKKTEKNTKKKIFKVGGIVGTIVGFSVGIASTIILFLIILIIIFVYRQRSKKKKKEQLTRQAIDQRTEMANLENGTSSTNNEGHNVLSAYLSLNTADTQGQYTVLDPSVTQYEEPVTSQLLPVVIGFEVAEGDENVYHEID